MAKQQMKPITITGPGGIIFKGVGPVAAETPKLSWKKWPSAQMDKINAVINWDKNALKDIKNGMK